MAKAKIKFRASSIEQKEGTIYFQVIHNRVAKQIKTGYKLFPYEWDAKKAKVIIPDTVEESRTKYLALLQKKLEEDMEKVNATIHYLDRKDRAYSVDDVVKAYQYHADDYKFISFAHNQILQLNELGKTTRTYQTSIKSFERFCGDKDIPLEEINSELMIAYENHLKTIGICPNSISFYMRNLRSLYNRAVEKGLVEQQYPFKHVYTGISKTIKRAVPLEVIRQIKNLDLSGKPYMDLARDIFMFSFYTRGMSFIDIAFLKKKDLQNGILSYRRQKTAQQLFIKWEKPMQDIVDKYDTTGTPYLLPIIKRPGIKEWRQYMSGVHCVNRNLRCIGEQLGLSISLTTYVARHGWASIAKSKNIPISTISEAMGHDSEATTRIYLASLDTSIIDKANKAILKAL